MTLRHDHDPAAEHMAALLGRRAHLESLDEQYGPNRGRTREHAAITWAADELAAMYPASVDRAMEIAAEHARWRAERDAQRGQEQYR